MSGKNDKKLRREVRRLYSKEAKTLAEIYAETNERLLKPRPRWFPEWLWIKFLSIFIYIKK